MFPIRDENPSRRTPIVTMLLVAVTAGVWLIVQGAGAHAPLLESICQLGLIPGELTGGASQRAIELAPGAVCLVDDRGAWLTVLTSMFLHGGWFHIIGNMWFLWVFGNNVEDSMGRIRFLLFYLLCGAAAAMAQVVASPSSAVPMVGASGAVSGVMGAYIVLFPRVTVHMLVFLGFFITVMRVPAFVMLGYWFLLQVIGGLPQIAGGEPGGVAFWAHAGGFVAGALLVFLFRNRALLARHRAR
ncbi:MAG TPA: rhomboid family intramembrane serine protease [Kofleriaceae bacterium]|nr:rhomboid family intramembrane serine protease [Kofleriaceae bacterium]